MELAAEWAEIEGEADARVRRLEVAAFWELTRQVSAGWPPPAQPVA